MKTERLPGAVLHCCETLRRLGYAAYPVGGCVRDLLLGRRPGDWDIATSARPEAVMAAFSRTVPTGLRHGTVTVLLEGMSLEVTTFRREGAYDDGRRPGYVSFDAGLHEDLARRDFTVNAMALGADGAVIDPFGGRADLTARLIRCVGAPAERLEEDSLRIFRAVRFAAQLDFAIEGETLAAMGRCAPLTARISGERIRAEVEKTLLSPRAPAAGLFVDLGLLARFGAAPPGPDLTPLLAAEAKAVPRWRCFCALTGLDIKTLPVERSLRRAVLHPELEQLERLALTGGDLYAIGLRGREISRTRLALLRHVQQHPQDNERAALLRLLQERPREKTP